MKEKNMSINKKLKNSVLLAILLVPLSTLTMGIRIGSDNDGIEFGVGTGGYYDDDYDGYPYEYGNRGYYNRSYRGRGGYYRGNYLGRKQNGQEERAIRKDQREIDRENQQRTNEESKKSSIKK
jgi:hypothetical protein